MKRQLQRHLIILLTLLAYFMGFGLEALADNRTITIKVETGCQWRYRTGGSGDWSAYYSTQQNLTIADNTTLNLQAVANAGCYFAGWNEGNMRVSTNTYFDYTVNGSNKTFTASCGPDNIWKGTLNQGSTYRLYSETVNGNPNGFRVICRTDNIYGTEGRTFEYVGNLITNLSDYKKYAYIMFYTTKPVLVKGVIKVERGRMQLLFDNEETQGNPQYYNHVTLKRAEGNTTGCLVEIDPISTTLDECRLFLTGNTNGNLIIDGGCEGMAIDSTTQVESSGIQTYKIDFTHTGGIEASHALLYLRGGGVSINRVTLKNNWSTTSRAGAIDIENNSIKTGFEVAMQNSLIEWCRNKDYSGGIKFAMSTRGSSFSMTNCEMRYNFTYNGGGGCGGGAIRSMGSNLCTLSITGCEFHHCYSDGSGGAIYWNSALIDPLQLKNSTFRNNFSYSVGGAMRIEAGVNIQNCTIKNNTARSSGGAIYYTTFTGGGIGHLNNAGIDYYFPADGILKLDANTIIKGNKALTGYAGAIYVYPNFITISNNTSSPIPIYLNDEGKQFKMKLVMNGATIEDNSARDGGAFHFSRNTDYYGLEMELNYGSIKHNSAAVSGGAMRVSQSLDANYTVPSGGTNYTNPATGTIVHLVSQPVVTKLGQETSTANKLNITKNEAAQDGAVGYITAGDVYIYDNATIGGSTADANKTVRGHGGCAYVNGGNLTMLGGVISHNSVTRSSDYGGQGGAFYVKDGLVEVKGGTITENVAGYNGGAFYIFSTNASDLTKINSSVATTTISNNQSGRNGGAINIERGTLQLEGAATTITGNQAALGGGGIYVNNGSVSISDATISNNTALVDNGGGIYAKGAVTLTGASISGNHADNEESGLGGGIYAVAGSNTITVESNSTISNNTAKKGAGIYAQSGNVSLLTSSKIVGNVASKMGGGVYSNGGTTTINCTGAGYIGASGHANTAKCGGGIYAAGGTVNLTSGFLQYNTASEDGGGIYAAGGTVNVQYASDANGTVRFNSASERGGGLFISETGTLYLKNHATIEKNHVPLGCKGGGVYLLGTVQAGTTGSKSNDVITVKTNYAANTAPATYNPVPANVRNNIYLPDPKDTEATDVITIVNGGLNLSSSSVGFSVPGNFLPVIYCADNSYLNDNQTAIINSVFEDSERFTARYYPSHATYKNTYIYLVADTWPQMVTALPASGYTVDGDGNVTISNEVGLAWLISRVNGLNINPTTNPSATSFSGKTITLTKDIDMSRYGWVPIGMTGATAAETFQGTFDGGGHVIKGINCTYLGEGDSGTGSSMGLFGEVNGAVIHDVFLNDARIVVNNASSEETFFLGGIASKGSATISNCITNAYISSNNTNTTIGGLVGNLTGGTIHSSSAMAEMIGYTMGGLVGTNGGNLYNSFTNPKFTYSGTGADYVGGLSAVNNGTIQNDYVRFTRASSLGSAKFGQIVGYNNSSATTCYHPTTYDSSIPSDLIVDGSVSSTVYGDVVAPYLYNHSNDNLVGSSTETLCKKLNDWVTINNSTSDQPTCASWKRTTAGSYSVGAGDINGDYPIHEYEGYTCVASMNGLTLDYCTSLDGILERHANDNITVNLYANDATTSSTGNHAIVYIDEDISLLQDVGSSNPTSSIEAYTSQTLPGSPRSWHFLSSSLSNSGIGFNYGQSALFNWEPNPCHVTISNDDDAALFPSDMPMSDGYADVSKIDLYAFYEPEYHWINLKRNSASHWHMNATNQPINYTNETTLTPGKGYLVSIDQDQLLQNRGTLNNGEVEIALGYTPAQEWAGLVGYNLIGNPYQSYLDFSAFASQNSGLWYDGSKGKAVEPTYAVYDSEMGGYIQYKEGASRGSKSASGILNMHQGFMVRSSGATRAKFTNAMRTNEGNGVSFRGEQPAYPLINLTVTDNEGVNDFAVLELGRDRDEGAEKLRANDSKGWLYLHHGSEDYGILFRTEVDNYQPLWFEADEAGSYTLSWETANAEFEALTLVDNITGVVTDMLAHDRYTFEATPEQYASRFKIVVGDYKDIEENEAPEPVEGPTFAYVNNGNIVLTGLEPQGGVSLQIIDMTGREILCRDASHASVISADGIASGIYVLRLTDGKGTKIQKIVIE